MELQASIRGVTGTTTAMIEFQQLAKRFNKAEILKGIDLGIQRGNRVALVGSNGAGKTTLIRCLLGEYNFDGQVLVDGLDARSQRGDVLNWSMDWMRAASEAMFSSGSALYRNCHHRSRCRSGS
jgi:ABC-type polar amino acid transport system ATPase subunit